MNYGSAKDVEGRGRGHKATALTKALEDGMTIYF
jgi:hypothetical protein